MQEKDKDYQYIDDNLIQKITQRINHKEILKQSSFTTRKWFLSRSRNKVKDDYIFNLEQKKQNKLHEDLFFKILPKDATKLTFLHFTNFLLKSDLRLNIETIMSILDNIDIKKEKCFDVFKFIDFFNDRKTIAKIEQIIQRAINFRKVTRKNAYLPQDLSSILHYIHYKEKRRKILTSVKPNNTLEYLAHKMQKLMSLNSSLEISTQKVERLQKEILKRQLNRKPNIKKMIQSKILLKKSIKSDALLNSSQNLSEYLANHHHSNFDLKKNSEKSIEDSVQKIVSESILKGNKLARETDSSRKYPNIEKSSSQNFLSFDLSTNIDLRDNKIIPLNPSETRVFNKKMPEKGLKLPSISRSKIPSVSSFCKTSLYQRIQMEDSSVQSWKDDGQFIKELREGKRFRERLKILLKKKQFVEKDLPNNS